MSQSVIAIDVGGTYLKGGLLDQAGRFDRIRRAPTRREEGPDAVVQAILQFAAQLQDEAPATPAGLGIALPGLIDRRRGIAVAATNLRWRNVPFADLLRERLGIPIVVDHDVRCGAIAEHRAGAAQNCADFLFVTLGTGVGASLWVDGKPVDGARSAAGELGHIIIDPSGDRCGCGRPGCLETIASASSVARRYRERSGAAAAGSEAVAQALLSGDPVATAVWHEAVDALALGLINTAILLDPARIVIGGGMAAAGETLFTPLRERIAQYMGRPNHPVVVPAQLGPDAGVTGAGYLAWSALSLDRRPT